MAKKHDNWETRIERVLKLSLAIQREILTITEAILAALLDAQEDVVAIVPGTPKFLCKPPNGATSRFQPPSRQSRKPRSKKAS